MGAGSRNPAPTFRRNMAYEFEQIVKEITLASISKVVATGGNTPEEVGKRYATLYKTIYAELKEVYKNS
jgi:hypothetical protein